jgi:hypothetical protein
VKPHLEIALFPGGKKQYRVPDQVNEVIYIITGKD